ncbi:hypothetical protein [uncultured Polaribacter sp.]|uniref:hypothetical protein n=1 Tax=uncultured Polaribacter sp. TaxID=174711 RepID=UPI002603D45C|nr:hypothetical protein [uncultured Polaribacter sp.]
MRVYLLFLFSFFYSFSFSQDTTFVKTLNLEQVKNIDYKDGTLIFRTSSKLYKFEDSKIVALDASVSGSFTWLKNRDTYWHSNQIPQDKVLKRSLGSLLPGNKNNSTTYAVKNNQLFVCYNGVVLLYKINPWASKIFLNKSVRNVHFYRDSIFINTYKGIFRKAIFSKGKIPFESKDDYYEKLKSPYFGSGEFSSINDKLYLSSYKIFKINGNTSDVVVDFNLYNDDTYIKLINYKEGTYALSRLGFKKVNIKTYSFLPVSDIENLKLNPGEDFSDAEVYNNSLIISTTKGNLYSYNGFEFKKIETPPFRIKTLSVVNKLLFIAADDGVYSYDGTNCIKNMQLNNVAEVNFFKGHYYVSTFSGLFSFTQDFTLKHTLVSNIEFNRYALAINHGWLFAGSVDGLYVLNLNSAHDNIYPYLDAEQFIEENNFGYFVLFILIFILIIFFLYILYLRKKTKVTLDKKIRKKAINFTVKEMEKIVFENEQIKSVEDLAVFLSYSKVQLTRVLKLKGTRPLEVLKSGKKLRVLQMIKEGETIERISVSTGYSVKYIKTNFLE